MAIPPGSGAIFTANLNSSYGVDSFTISNGGSGYDQSNPPKIIINDVSTPTVAGVFRPIITGGTISGIRVISSGSGYIPSESIRKTAVGIASMGIDDATGTKTLKAIYIQNSGIGYISQPQVTISDPESLAGAAGTYHFNEVVYGERSRTEARVKSWDQDTLILQVSNVSIGSTQKGFFPGEKIIGKDSGAVYSTASYTHDDTYDKYTENDEFEKLADDIIDFTESNPFGTF